MAAGDDNRNAEQPLDEDTLQARRNRFLEAVTDVDDETQELVASNSARVDLLLPDAGQNNEFAKRKFSSLDPFGGENSPDFRRRKIVCQRSTYLLDPINKYYAMGQDDTLGNKVTFTPIATDEFYQQHGRGRVAVQGYSLSEEPPGSINVNFSFGGYRRSEQVTNGIPNLTIRGIDAGDKDDILFAQRNEVRLRSGLPRGYVFPPQFPSGTMRDSNFNFYNEITRLATAGQREIFETLEEALNFYPPTNVLENGNLTKTISGPMLPGRRWQPSPRMNRILRYLRYDEYDDFEDDHQMFATEPGGGPDMYSDRHIGPNNRPYAGYSNSIHAVLLRLRERYSLNKALGAARAGLTRRERAILSRAQTPQVFEFYDFETETSFVSDPFTNVLTENNTTREQVSQRTIPAATINADYIYTLDGYESAITTNNVPEAALPNLYVYQIAASTPSVARLTGRGWDSSPNGDEVRRGYDRLVRLGEFITGTLPVLSNQVARGSNQFRNYLRQYGEQTRGAEVTVDFTSEIARRYREISTDATSMMLYKEFNGYKREFPMYIELGIPMVTTGSVNTLLLQSLSTTAMVNSIKNTSPSGSSRNTLTNPFKVSSYGVIAPQSTLRLGTDAFDQRQREIATVEVRSPLKVYQFDSWLDNTVDAIENEEAEITLLGRFSEREGGAGALGAFRRAIRREVNRQASNKLVKYREFLEGRKNLCESETILFKLVKYKSDANDYRRRQIVQTYYFPNTDGTENRPLTSEAFQQSGLEEGPQDIEYKIINFVDTQVKYNQNYQYELYAYDIVYGSKFSFRTRSAIYPERNDTMVAEQDQDDGRGTLAFFSFNVQTEPNVKVVEYPVSTFAFRPRNRGLDQRPLPYSLRRPDMVVGGVAYPIVKVIDLPPVTPEVSILPYKRQNKVLINLSPSVGEYRGLDSLPFIAFDDEERRQLTALNAEQTSNSITFNSGRLSYREVDGISRMLIYRTTEMNVNVATPEQLYESFSGKLYKILDPSTQAPPESRSRALDFIDEIEPNVKYYYTFRAQSLKDMISNPTIIYEVELVEDEGFFTPVIQEFHPQVSTPKKESKSFTRFLEIKASDLQSEPYTQINETAGYSDPRTGQFVARKSLVPQTGDDGIAGNKFIVRLTSKDTGRKVNIVIDFDVNENR